ncbi:hypothetical protein ACH427_09710 [Streptomyces sp. NPDC020379]|uniref:hypothetical protein n=1 Tax=Streptomyces sp. NPDC020379 TaxID=3365071 RepID=UPI0037A201B7
MRIPAGKPRAAAAALVLTTLAGCGVTTTDAIDAGQPATGARRRGVTSTYEVRLYFMTPTGIASSSRDAGDRVGPEDAVALLLKGPNQPEKERGMYSDLPKMNGEVHVTTGTMRVGVQLPYNVLKLSPVARSQLVCTAANAEVPPGRPIQDVKVELSGGSYVVSELVCDNNNAFPAAQLPTRTAAPVP